MRTHVSLVWLASLLLTSVVTAQSSTAITVGELPGSGGSWQQGQVTVAAPVDRVQHWFGDTSAWASRFPDTRWSQPLGQAADGRKIVRFKSQIIGRPLTLYLRERPGSIVYDGTGKDVTTQGKIFFERVDDNHTRVIIQSTSQVHGAAGIFASPGMRRKKAQQKIRADLEAVQHLSSATATTPRQGG